MDQNAPRSAVVLAFLAVYVIWGSTYLAIRFCVETMPPFLSAAIRFAVAGLLMFTWCRLRGTPWPTRLHWRNTFVIGTLLLLGGNGLVTWAEQWVPSGLAALLVACLSLWMVLFAWVAEPANRPGAKALFGLALGFLGVGVLVQPGGDLGSDPQLLAGAGALIAATAFWALGSVWSRRVELPENALMVTGMEMLGGAAALTIVAALHGDFQRLDVASISPASWAALAYLIVFGSIVAFSAYVWLLKVSSTSKVATYAYVNPIVAVFLGWAIADEPVTATTLLAAGIIIGAVVLITTDRGRGGRRGEGEPEPVDVDGMPDHVCPSQRLAPAD